MNDMNFSGSYKPSDVSFLLKPVEIGFVSVEEKERLIQSGESHYSDLLTQEPEPSENHLRIYNSALEQGIERLSKESLGLAKGLIDEMKGKPIILVSLVRAGVPLGVMLKRGIELLGGKTHHYGISIIRDRGIDDVALDEIINKHGHDGIVFVDGWTGKGAIKGQLSESLAKRKEFPLKPRLVVLTDPCGVAWMSASQEDWLIPFGILGAPVSGMISRSVWTEEGYHGCVHCSFLDKFECGNELADRVESIQQSLVDKEYVSYSPINDTEADELYERSKVVVKDIQNKFGIEYVHRIKPGIAEATRAVLRRVPEHVMVGSVADPDVELLVHLANSKGIDVLEVGDAIGKYRAITVIKKVK